MFCELIISNLDSELNEDYIGFMICIFYYTRKNIQYTEIIV